MLTQAEIDVQAQTKMIPPTRVEALIHALRSNARDAKEAARACDDPNGQLAASLRGKASGYHEATLLVDALLNGRPFRARRWSSATRAKIAFRERRAARREVSA